MVVDTVSEDSKSDSYLSSLLECQFNSFKVAHIGLINIIMNYLWKNTVVFIEEIEYFQFLFWKGGGDATLPNSARSVSSYDRIGFIVWYRRVECWQPLVASTGWFILVSNNRKSWKSCDFEKRKELIGFTCVWSFMENIYEKSFQNPV